MTTSQQTAGLQTLVNVQIQTIKKGEKKFRGFQSRFHPFLENFHMLVYPTALLARALTRHSQSLSAALTSTGQTKMFLAVGWFINRPGKRSDVLSQPAWRHSDEGPRHQAVAAGWVSWPPSYYSSGYLGIGFFPHIQVHISQPQLIRGPLEKTT